MKKQILLLLLICTLVFAASCGNSGDTSYISGDAAYAGTVPFAVEEPSEIGVSEITEDTFAAPE